jgi:nucleotide-binding universal stress UspA family protein
MSTPTFVILAAVDASPTADLVIARAAAIARATPGVELHLLHVPVRFTHATITPRTFDLDEGRRVLDAALAQLQTAAGLRVVGHLIEREPTHAILQLASSLDADLVVVGAHDHRGPERWFLGSVAQKVAQRAPCAVLVARPKAHDAVQAPEIEPPCPQCVQVQRASQGTRLWCARHAEHHPHGHVHYELPQGFGAGSSLVRGGDGT